jgi:hypothetical protein
MPVVSAPPAKNFTLYGVNVMSRAETGLGVSTNFIFTSFEKVGTYYSFDECETQAEVDDRATAKLGTKHYCEQTGYGPAAIAPRYYFPGLSQLKREHADETISPVVLSAGNIDLDSFQAFGVIDGNRMRRGRYLAPQVWNLAPDVPHSIVVAGIAGNLKFSRRKQSSVPAQYDRIAETELAFPFTPKHGCTYSLIVSATVETVSASLRERCEHGEIRLVQALSVPLRISAR